MSTIACPKCKRLVITMDVVELNDIVLFEVDEAMVLIESGTRVVQGCTPHICQGMPVSVTREKYIPPEKVKIDCKYCGEETLAIEAKFDVEDGWRCSLCIKDRAEQEEKRRKQAGHR